MKTKSDDKKSANVAAITFASIIVVTMIYFVSVDRVISNITTASSNINVYPQIINNSSDAISRATTMFPSGFIPNTIVVKLISGQKFDEWRGVIMASLGRNSPVWLVVATGTISGTPATINDMSQFDSESDTRQIDGVFYAYEANNGHLVGNGAIGNQWNQNLNTFSSLQEDNITIVTPSIEPSETPITSTPQNPE